MPKPRSYEEKYEKDTSIGAMLANRFNDLKGELKVQLPARVKSVDYQNNQVDLQILDYDHDEAGNLVPYLMFLFVSPYIAVVHI